VNTFSDERKFVRAQSSNGVLDLFDTHAASLYELCHSLLRPTPRSYAIHPTCTPKLLDACAN
jgi:hypothetical protein